MAMAMATETVGSEMLRTHPETKMLAVALSAQRDAAALGVRIAEDHEGLLRCNIMGIAKANHMPANNYRDVFRAYAERQRELLLGGGER